MKHMFSLLPLCSLRHSLGGAQAILHGLDLLNYNGTRYNAGNLLLFSQGQPRIGNLNFAEYELSTNIPIKRLVNKRDCKYSYFYAILISFLLSLY